MRRLWLHLGFLVPLLIVCASFMLLSVANSTLASYEQALNKDYSVIIISHKGLQLGDINGVKNAKELSELSSDEMLKRLSSQLSAANIKTLKAALPHFYSLNFSSFMSEQQIKLAKNQLLKINGIERVEVFSKTHTKVYHLLLLLKGFSYVASIIIAVLCWVLFSKQTRIWIYEHAERIYILEIFGASFFGRCGFMLKMVFINCILCFCILLAVFLNFFNFSFVRRFYEQLDAPLPNLNVFSELSFICIVAALISMLAVILVLKKANK